MIDHIQKEIAIKSKIACLTLDFEMDYGDRTGCTNLLDKNSDSIYEFSEFLKSINIPISLFIVGKLLEKSQNTIDLIKNFDSDLHCHSYSHSTSRFDIDYEIKKSKEVFDKYLNHSPIGYRAPQGVINLDDINYLKRNDFEFSSSIFPSFRFSKFNNMKMPINPFQWNNGLIEFPFAVISTLRIIYSLSYLKLIGFNFVHLLSKLFGLPNVLIIDSHLHDLFHSDESLQKVKGLPKYAWSIRKNKGQDYLQKMIKQLKREGYAFISMSELIDIIKKDI